MPEKTKITAIVGLVSALVFCLASCAAKPVLILVRTESIDLDFSLENELGVMVDSLDRFGLPYRLASMEGDTLKAGGKVLPCDLRIKDVRVKDYRAIIVPCMGSGRYAVPQEMVEILKRACEERLIIAAQHSEEIFKPAALALYISTARSPGIVVDGRFITSYNSPNIAQTNHKPPDTENLILALRDALR